MNKIVVYTFNLGGKDLIKPIRHKEKGVDYVCFSDDFSLIDDSWEHITICNTMDSLRRVARWFKANAHILFRNYKYSIWVDGRLELNQPIQKYIDLLKDCDIATNRHPIRDCIYDEGAECIKQSLDLEKNIKHLLHQIEIKGYPKNNGLAETGVFIRRHTKQVEQFNTLWSNILMQVCIRDQLSFDYLMWALKMKYAIIPEEWRIKRKHEWSE